jgi:hypothetical protein
MTIIGAGGRRGAESLWRRFATRRRRVAAVAAIGPVAAGSLAFWLVGGGSPGTTIARNGEVRLQGQITRDGCDMARAQLPVGDVGCSITVNGYEVSVVHGNVMLAGQPGTVTGLDASTDQAGRHAAVYARITGPHTASILGAPKYYARISG